jgi:hypothetical protein
VKNSKLNYDIMRFITALLTFTLALIAENSFGQIHHEWSAKLGKNFFNTPKNVITDSEDNIILIGAASSSSDIYGDILIANTIVPAIRSGNIMLAKRLRMKLPMVCALMTATIFTLRVVLKALLTLAVTMEANIPFLRKENMICLLPALVLVAS